MYIYPYSYFLLQYIKNQIYNLFYLCLLNKMKGNFGIGLKIEENSL